MQDIESMRALWPVEPFDVAFHLAWSGVTGESRNLPSQITDNVVQSLLLWEALRQHGCKAFVGLGSQAEYGPHSGMLTEATPVHPQTAYGVAKLTLGMQLQEACMRTGMRFLWFRLLSAYGPADDEKHMVPSLVQALMEGKRPALTAGEQMWDYLYVQDAAEALCLAAESAAEGTFNLGSGHAVRLRDFVSAVRDCIDPALPIGFGDVPYRPDQVMHLQADITRLSRATGWHPETSMQEGIQQTVAWYKGQR
jgi:nucleoside-diphosphate-sugar epimerase